MFTAIMAATPDNRIAKRADFLIEEDADAHAAAFPVHYPYAFVVPTPVEPEGHWLLDMEAQTLTIVPPPPPDFDATDQATVDRLLLESGVTRAQIKTLFDHENRIRVLEGRPEVTVEKLKTALWKLIRGA